ncbi:MAG: NAD(+) synthase [Lentisphaerae bacterium]|nr:NAD(+) synthase [Lentisphaerota bacterium]
MKTRGIRLRLAQMEVIPADPAANTARMLDLIEAAKKDRVVLIAFPEMAIPGYLIGDMWEREAFLRDCQAAGEQIRKASKGILVVFGNVGVDWKRKNEDGRVRKYNACFVAHNKAFHGPSKGPYPFVIKTLLPNYREFDDSRHFCDVRKLAIEEGKKMEALIAPVSVNGLSLGCILCEDAWDMDYGVSPLTILGKHPLDLVLNISCSPFTLNKNHKRNQVFSRHAVTLKTPLAYVNNVGLQNNGKTVYTFDGASCVYDSHGNEVTDLAPFEDGVITFDLPTDKKAPFGRPVTLTEDGITEIYQALRYGTGKFMRLCGATKVAVGVSGGIDSAVVAALYGTLLKPENLLLVNMPSRFNSSTTIALSRTLAANLGCFYTELSIEAGVRLTAAQVDRLDIRSPDGRLRKSLKLTEFMKENVQARDRSARVLAAVASAFGGVFTCNGNKSETTVGYVTFYGDLAGYLATIADLWKWEVYALGHHLNDHVYRKTVIPDACFTLTPSAELSPAQAVDEGKGDPLHYPYHDRLFASWVEWWNRATPEDILTWFLAGTLESKIGYAGNLRSLFPTNAAFIADLERWWTLYQGMAVAKRIQAPPVLAVKRRAFGFDHREAQTKVWFGRRYEELKRKAME